MFRTLSSKQMMDVQGLRFLLDIRAYLMLIKYAKGNSFLVQKYTFSD